MKELKKINKYLKVSANEIYAKVYTVIHLNINDYKTLKDDFIESESDSPDDEESLEAPDFLKDQDISKIITIPGTFKIDFPDDNDSIDLYFPYSINILKNRIQKETSSELILEFEKGELISFGYTKKTETDIQLLSSIMENSIKFLKGKIDRQVYAAWNQIHQGKPFSLHHLEVLLSQQYIAYDEESQQYKPIRLLDKEYSAQYAVNSKESTHKLGEFSSFTYSVLFS